MTTVICKSLQQVELLISNIQKRTFTKYVVHKVDKKFSNDDWQLPEKFRVQFEKKDISNRVIIPFTGIPFTFIGSRILTCHQGKDKNKAAKKKYAEQKESGYHNKQRRCHVQITKKVDCPAVLTITRIAALLDEEFYAYKDTERIKRKSSDLIKHFLSIKKTMIWENRYYVFVPQLEEHVGHPTTGKAAFKCESEELDPRVDEKIKQLSMEGQVTSVPQMLKCIKRFVKNTLFKDKEPPQMLNRRYFPLAKDVRNIMNKAQDEAMHSTDDQVTMQDFWREFIELYKELPATWKVMDKIYSNNAEKDKAYEALINKLKQIDPNATRKTVIARIKQFRLNFRRELKKVKASRAKSLNGLDEIYKPIFMYYEDLSFLTEDVLEAAKSSTKIKKPKKKNIEIIDIKNNELLTIACQSISKPQPQPHPQPHVKKEAGYAEEPEDMLIKYWASIYKTLDSEQKTHVKKGINDLLHEGQMGLLNSQSVKINIVQSPNLTTVVSHPSIQIVPSSQSGQSCMNFEELLVDPHDLTENCTGYIITNQPIRTGSSSNLAQPLTEVFQHGPDRPGSFR